MSPYSWNQKARDPYILTVASLTIGGDPEFFFESGGKVIGAERVLKEGGKEVVSNHVSPLGKVLDPTYSAFVLDGVQIELNPRPQSCRTALGNEISLAFRSLRTLLDKMKGEGASITPSFKATILLDKEELDALSDQSKVAGCKPSFNLYDGEEAKVNVDYATHLGRSAGGHIHLGFQNIPWLMEKRVEIVPILDVLLGLPCVLIDRDPGNVVRRRHYGRASEHRLPDHGLEYRTLSNFWLRAFPLTSFVMGQARNAVQVLGNKYYKHWEGSLSYWEPWDAPASLLSQVDLQKVKEAINFNDLDLAEECWEPVSAWIEKHFGPALPNGLNPRNIHLFNHFRKKVKEEGGGLGYWFKDDPFDHWCNLKISDSNGGWESFLKVKVQEDLTRSTFRESQSLCREMLT